MKANRLHNLDYLRGLCAIGIMSYHYTGYAYQVHLSPDDFIQKIGIYGVSIFYVLSGLTLYHVYSPTLRPDGVNLPDFFIKRAFRIMPLLWALILINLCLREWPGTRMLVLNLTGLFSILAPDEYFVTGLWSIGNELSFYLLFPVLMVLLKRSIPLLLALSLVVLGFYSYYAFYVFPGFDDFNKGVWEHYVNPLNQAFLFLSGFLCGVLMKDREVKTEIMLCVLLLALGMFAFFPVQGGGVLPLMTGGVRMLYTVLAILICLAAYKGTYQLPSFLDKPLRLLGEISYSVYLLHPVVWMVLQYVSSIYTLPVSVRLVLSVVGTLTISYFSFRYFEQYFIRLGRKFSASLPKTVAANRKVA
ncbi:peptidoglycan/LPS O-acetylase OafA/YrhL [Pontibacter ummariensis]|uniref:Peptidoglycan/LPS O-acetylase OafA/YrhL, contains acyltransferase and SGNH-hydrolase domains n=1 Tax=Pontibacter ummariensis TaxID=1610492 RepID=A0A239DK21_9BACT|nr:acyltransferase [Pontibacter ummariensis]PRY14438.1 peptidoglycan/LPS O-acetylase OafA/YrhL [Pontibacter ummariensis]SNS31994.1 Peptidoglycan/LPS O-acetylase OafA/YrhL, contains acyltransferase and SGNH-hydrolase domains [Pontibacter ummariensis]